jgi:hypothetical protein
MTEEQRQPEVVVQPEVGLSDIIQRIVNDGDNDRLKSFTSLLNTFNYAVQIQSGRQNWEPADFKLYAIALSAMDQVGRGEPKVRPLPMQKSMAGMQK